ncbi:MAG: FkbM family methyltransferase [Campylobacteraceae bacterium]|jgi:FkbM family methyltransferase|nr:FkbM family methyltransferase [Campylobacteraceae bacterium]
MKKLFGHNGYAKAISKQMQKWLKTDDNSRYFDFNGAKLPDISDNINDMVILSTIFEDTFFISCYLNDNYDKSIVEELDKYMPEGPYGYTDGKFDVTVKKGDTVIDAGAWIGDFSAYAASKEAIAYAFEPTSSTFKLLQKTAKLNNNAIYPILKGLSDSECEKLIHINEHNSGGNTISLLNEVSANTVTEMIQLTTLDKFAQENKLTKIDFIKADIEGAERDMLRGGLGCLKILLRNLLFAHIICLMIRKYLKNSLKKQILTIQ